MALDRHSSPSERDATVQGGASAVEDAFTNVLVGAVGSAPTSRWTGPYRIEVNGPVEDFELLLEHLLFGLPYYVSPDPPRWAEEKLAGLLPQHGALGDYLEPLPPGERLVRLLAAIDLEGVDDYSLVEVVSAHKRVEAWSAAKAAGAAAALAERPALNPSWPGEPRGRTRGEQLVGNELAMRLRISKLTGTRMAAAGRAFTNLLAPTGQFLELGLIDYPRAQAIFTHLDGLPPEVAIAAQWEVLEKAPGRTLRQVQQDLATAVIAVDPDDADARHRAARQQRRVNRPRPLPDGMASFSAVLTAVDAIALDVALDAAARAAKHPGSQRTLDQLRADALALMGHTALALGFIGPHPAGCTCGCSDSPPARPVQPANAPAHAAEPSTDPPTARSLTPEHRLSGQASASGSPPAPGHRIPGGAPPRIKLGSLGGVRADIRVTVPLSVALPDLHAPPRNALERDPEPVAELDGYGPLTPEVARALAAGGVWRRLVTDPVTHEVLDVGRTRYRPPPGMAELVRERDRTCITPGCCSPARCADLDHLHEWQDGGETSVWNLGAMCTSDHPVKTMGGYTVARASDGTYAFTAITGHGYLRRRDGTVITLPRRTARELRAIGKEHRRTGRSVAAETVDTVLAAVAAGSDVGGMWSPPALPRRSAGTGISLGGGDTDPDWTDAPPF